MENQIVRLQSCESLHGRTKIMVNADKITASNVAGILESTLPIDACNVAEINYLYDVYRGIMDIRYKTKTVRPQNNNKVVINIPNKIVTFKSSFLLSSPIQYIAANGNEEVSEKVAALNSLMSSEDKESKDKECVDWMHICGIAPRMVLPDPDFDEEGSPVAIYSLDPREAFVIYSSRLGKKPLAGVLKQYDDNGEIYFNVYTPNFVMKVSRDGEVYEFIEYDFGRVPIVEYPNNEARLGAFEIVLSPINQINTLESARVDNVVDFVNAFDVFQNCEITGDKYSSLSEGGMYIQVKSVAGAEAKVYRISSEISQSGVQTELNALYDYIDEITGMPNRNGGSSTSDTGQATIFRDGWQDAESRASDSEKLFIRSEKEVLKLILKMYRDKGVLDLNPSDVKVQFTRKNLTDIQSKAQVLCELLNNPKVHPRIAYECAALLPDVEAAYRLGMEWYNQQNEEAEMKLEKELENERALYNNRQGNSSSSEESSQEISAS